MNETNWNQETRDHMIKNGYDPDIPEECLSYCNWIDNYLRNLEYKNPDYTNNVKEKLSSIHPYYKDATIENITWELYCKNCGGQHKFDTDTTELDYCCDNPNYGEIANGE